MSLIAAHSLLEIGAARVGRYVEQLMNAASDGAIDQVCIFWGIIDAAEMIFRGCLLVSESQDGRLQISEPRFNELLYGGSRSTTSFASWPRLVKEHLEAENLSMESHKEMLDLRRNIILHEFEVNIIKPTLLKFIFEVLDQLVYRYSDEIIFMHLAEDDLEKRLDILLEQLKIKRLLIEDPDSP